MIGLNRSLSFPPQRSNYDVNIPGLLRAKPRHDATPRRLGKAFILTSNRPKIKKAPGGAYHFLPIVIGT